MTSMTSPGLSSRLVPATLVVAHAAFVALFSPMGIAESEYPAVAAYMAIGVIVVQPLLLAIWAAMGADAVFKRFAWAAAACAVVAYAGSIPSFRLMGKSAHKTDPFQELLFTLSIFGVFALIFLVVRRASSWRIYQPIDKSTQTAGNAQFSMKFLLGWITASAGLLAVGRVLIETGVGQQGSSTNQTAAEVLVFLSFLSVGLLPTVGIPWLVLAYRRRACLFVGGAVLAWAALTWGAVSVLLAVTPATTSEAVKGIVFLQLGAGLAGFLTALPLRLVGFRLERRPLDRVPKKVPGTKFGNNGKCG